MATRKDKPKKRKFRDHGGSLYEDDTPIDEATGAPPEEALIPDERARNMAMDAESSRMNAQHQNVIRKKTQGVPMAQWSSDPRIKYGEIYRFHPSAKVVIRMIEPYDDDNIPTRYLSQLNTYDKLIQHVKDTHWHGKQSSYKWIIQEDSGKIWGTGVIKFGPEREQPAHQPQQQMYNPYGAPQMGGQGWYGQQWGYPPPQQQMYPQQQQAPYYDAPQQQQVAPQAQVQQPAPQQAAPPQSMPHPDVLNGMLGYMERLTNMVIDQRQQQPQVVHHQPVGPQVFAQQQPSAPPGYIAQIPWQMMSQFPPDTLAKIPPHLLPVIFGNGFLPISQIPTNGQQPAAPPQAQPKQEQPAAPVSPVDSARDAMASAMAMMQMGRDFAAFVNPNAGVEAEPETPPVTPDPEPSPYQVQDIGPLRIVKDRETGEKVGGIQNLIMNSDKLGGVLDTVVSKVTGAIKERQQMIHQDQQMQIDKARQLADVTKEIADATERTARARALQAAAEASMRAAVPQPTQQTMSPPTPPPPAAPHVPAPSPPQQHFMPTTPFFQPPPAPHVPPPAPIVAPVKTNGSADHVEETASVMRPIMVVRAEDVPRPIMVVRAVEVTEPPPAETEPAPAVTEPSPPEEGPPPEEEEEKKEPPQLEVRDG